MKLDFSLAVFIFSLLLRRPPLTPSHQVKTQDYGSSTAQQLIHYLVWQIFLFLHVIK